MLMLCRAFSTPAFCAVLGAVLLAALTAVAAEIDCSFASSYPRQYVAYKTDADIVIDGSLTDPAWQEVAWSSSFVDISTQTKPKFDTRVKIRWDDTSLYVGGRISDPSIWANITHTCHCLDPNENQVIFTDNDFEIFCDPDGSNHMYKEYEMNAANATWDLCLNKPYDDGGYENSTRVYGKQGFDMQPPLHCKTFVNGTLNDPAANNQYWSVEVALPIAKLMYNTTAVAPAPGGYYRINFSRVEWGVTVVQGSYQKQPSCQSCPVPGTPVEDNWVWSPQGSIAMHLPDKWGMLQFADGPVNATAPVRNPEWTVRSVAMQLYYAQHAYADAHNGSYTSDVLLLAPYADPQVFAGVCTQVPVVKLANDSLSFVAYVQGYDKLVASVTDDRLLLVTSA